MHLLDSMRCCAAFHGNQKMWCFWPVLLMQFFQTLVNGCRSAMISKLSKQKCTMGMHLLDIDLSQIFYIGLSPLPVIVLVVVKRYCLQDKWCWWWFLWSLLLGGGTTQHVLICIYISLLYTAVVFCLVDRLYCTSQIIYTYYNTWSIHVYIDIYFFIYIHMIFVYMFTYTWYIVCRIYRAFQTMFAFDLETSDVGFRLLGISLSLPTTLALK